MSLERAYARLAVTRLLACASLLALIAPSVMAQDQRPWVDPPASSPASPPEPTRSADPPAVPQPDAPRADPAVTPRASATRPRPEPLPSARVPTAALPKGSSRVSRPKAATRIETRMPVASSPRTASAAQPRPAAGVRVTRQEDARREQWSRTPVARSLPSFNCQYAGTLVEHAICSDPVLASKDRRMALLYEQSGGSRHGPVDEQQWRWLAARNSCVRAPPRALQACIGQVYDARIAELSGARW